MAKPTYKNAVILIASLFFYSWGAPKFVFVLLATTIVDFYIVKQIYQSSTPTRRKTFLAISIGLNLGMLLYFKYANFFVDNLNASLSSLGFTSIDWTSIALPIGISFYTFETLTYSIDVYRKVHAPLGKVSDYLLYIMAFPRLIAGPIVRFNSIADQITNRPDSVDDKLMGFYRFSIGLAKKVLIANVMAEQADAIFNSPLESLTMAAAWLGALAYTFQIYFDFSGYSDMAIGLGRMMGFRFPENFNSPYIAQSISEFWRRWHITLGDFMRDYLYIPLGGNRVANKSRLYSNLLIVFLLSGLWHGASWNFVIWGAYHGMFLILDRLFLLRALKRMGKYLAIVFTFLIVMVGWIVFRLERLEDIKAYLHKLFAWDAMGSVHVNPSFKFVVVFAFLFSFIVLFNWGKRIEQFTFDKERYSMKQHTAFAFLSIALMLLSVSSISSSGFNPFIYFRF